MDVQTFEINPFFDSLSLSYLDVGKYSTKAYIINPRREAEAILLEKVVKELKVIANHKWILFS